MLHLQNQRPMPANMSAAAANKRRKAAKYAGCIYFILLGVANVIGTAIYSDHPGLKDFVVLALFCTPLLVNKKFYYLIFGAISTLLWAYLLFAVFRMNVEYVRGVYEHTNPYMSAGGALAVGYTFCAVSLFCSLLIIYAGLSDAPEKAVN